LRKEAREIVQNAKLIRQQIANTLCHALFASPKSQQFGCGLRVRRKAGVLFLHDLCEHGGFLPPGRLAAGDGAESPCRAIGGSAVLLDCIFGNVAVAMSRICPTAGFR
jgi:hypothetical protein